MYNKYNIFITDSPVQNSVATTDEQKPLSNEKNGFSDSQVITVQSSSSKVQDVISIGSRYFVIENSGFIIFLYKFNPKNIIWFSDEDISNDGLLNKNMNGNKNDKTSIQSRLQGIVNLLFFNR